MLAGLASQSLLVGWGAVALSFGVAIATFSLFLVGGAAAVSRLGDQSLRAVRTSGRTVQRWGGYVLVGLAGWFILLATLPNPPLM